MAKYFLIVVFSISLALVSSTSVFSSAPVGLIGEEIPSDIATQFNILSPSNLQISVKKEILVKGRNLMLTPVFVNGESVPLREDGRFFKVVPLPERGPNSIYISVWTPDHDFQTIRLTVLYEIAPSNVDRLGDLKRNGILILNSRFLDVNPEQLSLSASVTRYQFAYFLNQIFKGSPPSVSTSDVQFTDVPASSPMYPKLKMVSTAHLITDFPDGSFRPEAKISKLEYIIGVVKALDLPLVSESDIPTEFKDVPREHWANKYIATAVNAGLIPSGGKLSLNSDLSYEQFISLIARVSVIKEGIDVSKFLPANDNAIKERHFASLMRPQATPVAQLESNSILLKFPPDHLVTVSDNIRVDGVVSPPLPTLTINSTNVSANNSGEFSGIVTLTPGKNEIIVSAHNEKVVRNIYSLPTYKDMKGHWAEVVLAKMRYSGLIEDVPYFYPKSELTRELVAYYLSPLLNTDQFEEVPISDVVESNSFYQAIEKVVSLGIIPLDSDQKFDSGKTVTREEMLTMLAKAIAVKIPKNIPAKSVFSDLSSASQNYKYLFALRSAGFLAKSGKVYPKRVATKIEFLALISRTDFVQNKLGETFKND